MFLQEYKKTINIINKYNCIGIFNYAEKKLPHLTKKERELDNRINEFWDVNLEKFKEILQDYLRTILIILSSMGEGQK